MVHPQFRARVLAGSLFVAISAAPGAALACNPIQFLFGGCRPEPTPQPQPTLENLIERNQGPLVRAKRKAASSGSSHGARQVAIAPPEGASVGSVAHFAEDKTLKRGDVVVTSEGFLVYRGAGGVHSRDDFEPLTKARDDLASLEKASRQPGAAYAPTQTAVNGANATPRLVKPKAAKPENRDFEAKAIQ